MAITKAGTRQFFWQEGDLEYKLDSLQRSIRKTIYETPGDEICILSSRQIGKSYLIACLALEYCLRHPGCIVRIMASTLKQVGDIVSDNIDPIIADAPAGLIQREKSSHRWRVGQSSLRVGPLERAHVDSNRGGNAAAIFLEEGGFIPSEDYRYAIKSVIGPQLLRSGGRLFHVTTPSTEEVDHMIHTEILPKCELAGTAFRYTIDDSPQITPELRAKAVERCGGEKTIAWQVEYMAKIIRNEESVVIPPFSAALHVKQVVEPVETNWQVAIDFGGVRDKTAALLYTYDFMHDKFLWKDERVFEPNTSTQEIIEEIRRMERGYKIQSRWADAPGQLQIDLEQAHDYSVAIPLKDDWRAAVNALQVSFAKDRHVIDPGCKFLIQSLQFGRFNKNRTDFDRNPVLGHCDALAAMIYGYRMADQSNPYPYLKPHRDQFITVTKHKSEIQKVGEALVPKIFGGDFSNEIRHKRFGTFRK